jgi:hypothetical protein
MLAMQFIAAATVLGAIVAADRPDRTAPSISQTETVQPQVPAVPAFVPRATDRSPQLPREGTPFSKLFVRTLQSPDVSTFRGVPTGPQRPMDSCGMTLWMADGNLDPKIVRSRPPNPQIDFKITPIVPPVCVPTVKGR